MRIGREIKYRTTFEYDDGLSKVKIFEGLLEFVQARKDHHGNISTHVFKLENGFLVVTVLPIGLLGLTITTGFAKLAHNNGRYLTVEVLQNNFLITTNFPRRQVPLEYPFGPISKALIAALTPTCLPIPPHSTIPQIRIEDPRRHQAMLEQLHINQGVNALPPLNSAPTSTNSPSTLVNHHQQATLRAEVPQLQKPLFRLPNSQPEKP